MKFVIISLCCLLVGFGHESSAQESSLRVITEVPLNFGIGYEGKISKHFSAGGSMGLLTSPNSDIIIAYLKYIGTDQVLVTIIDDAFQLGWVGKVYFNYNFGRNYFGAFGQAVGAQAGSVSSTVIEDYFQTKIQNYPLLAGKSSASDPNLTVRTRLYQAGLLYGHRFPLKNNRMAINVEIGLSKNIGSTSKMYSDTRDMTELSDRLNTSLQGFYQDYAIIPSMAVMFVYKLKKPKD